MDLPTICCSISHRCEAEIKAFVSVQLSFLEFIVAVYASIISHQSTLRGATRAWRSIINHTGSCTGAFHIAQTTCNAFRVRWVIDAVGYKLQECTANTKQPERMMHFCILNAPFCLCASFSMPIPKPACWYVSKMNNMKPLHWIFAGYEFLHPWVASCVCASLLYL